MENYPDMSKMSKSERKALKKKLRKEREKRERAQARSETRKGNALKISLLVIIAVSVGFLAYMVSSAPGQYDSFAKCLTSKGAVIYGNDFCEYTKRQMGAFGNSFSYLNYVRCADDMELCASKGVDITPTWEINNQMYSGVQTFQKLAEASGC